MKPLKAAVAVSILAASALAPQQAAASSPTGHQGAVAEATEPLREAVAGIRIAPEDRTGYDREVSFGDWIDADRDGCHARNEVLLAEATVAPEVTGRCSITAGTGQWFSWYDGVTATSRSQVDIDHVVPLAEAWDSGASDWSREERVTYANYLDDERHLEAVTGRSNRSKADRDPAEWLPPDSSVTCRYVAYWTSVKRTWSLAADPTEHQALTDLAAECPNEDLRWNPIR